MESELANALINSATTVMYIAGLVAFVAWLQKKSGKKNNNHSHRGSSGSSKLPLTESQ